MDVIFFTILWRNLMKLIKSLSLPVLSLALLLPMANAFAFKNEAQDFIHHVNKQTCQLIGRAASSTQNLFDRVSHNTCNFLDSADKSYQEVPSFDQLRAIAAAKIELGQNSLKAALVDAKDAIVTYSARHPYIVLAAASTVAFGAGFWIARKLSRTKKNA